MHNSDQIRTDQLETPERNERQQLMSSELVEQNTPVGALAAVRCRRKSGEMGMGGGMTLSSPAVTAC
jgi:hypothetical protein